MARRAASAIAATLVLHAAGLTALKAPKTSGFHLPSIEEVNDKLREDMRKDIPKPFLNTTVCDKEDVTFAAIVQHTCQMNWILGHSLYPFSVLDQVGCWRRKTWSTDRFLSSQVYQRGERCVLGLSGYHGKIVGMDRAVVSLATPPARWDVCGNKVYAPFVRLLRHLTSQEAWKNTTEALADPSCKHISIASESMGGSMAEIFAACANMGRLHEVQNKSYPTFKVDALWSFGAPAMGVEPIRNPSTADGCWPGKRIFASGDFIAGLGNLLSIKHGRQDAVEIFHDKGRVATREYPCQSDDAISDAKHQPPEEIKNMPQLSKSSANSHEIVSYILDMKNLHKMGKGLSEI